MTTMKPERLSLPCASVRLLLLGGLLLPGLALAQTPPVDAGKALQETRPPQPSAPLKAPEPEIRQQETPPLVLPAGQTLLVKAIRFEGGEVGAAVTEAERQAAVAPYLGRALSMAEIEAAADKITRLYRERGYLVARVYVPKQDARDGTLTLRIVVGKYGKVSLHNRSLVRDAQIAAYFAPLNAAPITRDELERAMLLVGDLPGASLPKVSLAPGAGQESADLDIAVDPGARYNGYLIADNYGSRYTGKNRASLGAAFNSPFGLGDKVDFSGMSTDNGGLQSGRLAYSLPLGASGLRGELALGTTTYKLGDAYASLDAKGYANTLEANFSYPLQRSRTQNLNLTLGLVGRDMRDQIDSVGQITTKHAYAATLGVNHERYAGFLGRDAYFSLGGSLTWGTLSIDEAAMRSANQAGADTVGGYGHANLNALGRLALTDKLTTTAALSVQRAISRNLDSSEQLIISGTRGVMAYEQTVSGDNGVLANLEARYALPRAGDAEQAVSLFADAGHIDLYNANYTTTDGVNLRDVGLGYTLTWKTLFVRAQASQALGHWPSSVTPADRTRYLLQVGLSF